MRRLPVLRGWALLGLALGTVLYMLMVDAQPPVIRATVLLLVMCAAAYAGWSRLGFNSLALAALVVLAVHPSDLFHTGAQLSFLSVAGLVWFLPRWRQTGASARPAPAACGGQRGFGASRGTAPRPLFTESGADESDDLAADHAASHGPFSLAHAGVGARQSAGLDADGGRASKRFYDTFGGRTGAALGLC